MMRFAPRSLVAFVMALILGVTSVTMAVARGQSRVAGEIVICSGYGFTSISVDEFGNPVDTVHICPDMALGLFAALEQAPLILERPEGRASDLILVEPRVLLSRPALLVRVRGPPVLV